jgi:hypothetical protein
MKKISSTMYQALETKVDLICVLDIWISQWLSYSHVVPFVLLGHVKKSFINICEFNGMDFCVSH